MHPCSRMAAFAVMLKSGHGGSVLLGHRTMLVFHCNYHQLNYVCCLTVRKLNINTH